MKTYDKDRRLDSYEISFTRNEEAELVDEVRAMEENSKWVGGIPTATMELFAINTPLTADETATKYSLDADLTMDTAEGSSLILFNPMTGYELMRKQSRITLMERAQMSGQAFAKMSPDLFSDTVNNGLTVQDGNTLLLIRYGKLSALHSGAASGYQPLPISELLNVAVEMITRRFGERDFMIGSNSHDYTSCVWELPEAQTKILEIYSKALGSRGSVYPVNYMPAIRFSSSDTQISGAVLQPLFVIPKGVGGVYLPFTEGINVRHIKRGDEDAMEVFREEADKLMAQFEKSAEVIAQLANIPVYHACNCVVSLCNKYKIARKWGEAARVEAERIAIGEPYVTAHDIYMCMSEVLATAISSNATTATIQTLEEKVSKVLYAEWSDHDSGGVVPWGT